MGSYFIQSCIDPESFSLSGGGAMGSLSFDWLAEHFSGLCCLPGERSHLDQECFKLYFELEQYDWCERW